MTFEEINTLDKILLGLIEGNNAILKKEKDKIDEIIELTNKKPKFKCKYEDHEKDNIDVKKFKKYNSDNSKDIYELLLKDEINKDKNDK